MSSATTVNRKVLLFTPLGITTCPAVLPMSDTLAPVLLEIGLMVQVIVATPKEPLRITVRATVEIPASGSDT
jgi:hypothetical protein